MFGARIAADTVARGAPQIFVELGGMTILIRGRARARRRRGRSGPTPIFPATTPGHQPFPFLNRAAVDETLPALARELFAFHAGEYAQLQEQLKKVEGKLMAWHRADECSRRLAQIPGIGPIGALMLVMKTPPPFRSARHFAAWRGLTPKDHSTAGRVRLGVACDHMSGLT